MDIQLTHPVSPDELRVAFPRALRSVDTAELEVWLEIEEHALRSQYGVIDTGSPASESLRRAMLAAWPSFYHQVRQISSESSSTESHSVTYATLGNPIEFPSFVGTLLYRHADASALGRGPTTTELVR